MTEARWLPVAQPGWSILRLKGIVSCPVVKGDGIACPFVALEHIRSASGAVCPDFEWSPQSSEDCIFFRAGDVLFGKLRPYLRKYLQADRNGCCQSELLVLRPRDMRLSTRFLFYAVQSEPFIAWADATSYGVKMPRTSWEVLSTAEVLLPGRSDQDHICAFLDRETARTDTLIEKKERLIALLEEKRAALINRAVTKGLDPSAPMKDSGVPWLGLVPAHWEMKQLKWAVTLQRGHDLPSEVRGEGVVPVVSSCGKSGTHSTAAARGPGIVTGRYGTIGQFYLIEEDYWPLNTTLYSNDLHGNEPRFLHSMLTHLAPLFLLNAVKSAVPGVDRNDVHPTVTAIPPVEEQRAIGDFLSQANSQIDRTISKTREQIAKFQEYRTALISAAVTGKIDVRGIGGESAGVDKCSQIDEQ